MRQTHMRQTHGGTGMRRTALMIALFVAAFICVPGSSAIAEITYNSDVATMISGVTQAELEPVVEDLSGETTATIGGDSYTILTRGSSSGEPIDMAEQYVFEQLGSYGLDSVAYQSYPGKGAVDPGRNIIGQINGTTKASEIVLIGAHLDDRPWYPATIAPGADDNASGVSAVLYLAREFADKTFERTIRFVAFGSEENAPWTSNKYGSGYYADQAEAAGENIVAMISADALAYNENDAPWGVEMHTRKANKDPNGGDAAIVTEWEDVISTYSISDLDPVQYAQSMELSDHGAFWDNGYHAVLLIEESWLEGNPNWHTADDTVDTFNWSYYEQVIKSLVGLAAHLAGIATP